MDSWKKTAARTSTQVYLRISIFVFVVHTKLIRKSPPLPPSLSLRSHCKSVERYHHQHDQYDEQHGYDDQLPRSPSLFQNLGHLPLRRREPPARALGLGL